MNSREIRQSFLDYFASKEHRIVRSAPVIPAEDPTLLFTNAGMNQFKDVFLGKGTREYVRAADTQKCIRASGKHNDLEDVGRDTYHHTFFEMLGNWSFGDYYKPEAISWAWELLTEVWKLPKARLYATVYKDDEESFEIWKKETDIDPSHILKFGDKDNFWEMGESGPCGPCSEIHIDLTPDASGGELVNAGDHRVMELWNLVFIQYNRTTEGQLEPLPSKHVDTGMGFERVTAVMQGKSSNYDSDIFTPLFDRITALTGVAYTASLDGAQDIAMRVIADHARTLTFALSDGAVPGNEGRGYVLRRILRRALRYARTLGCHEPIMYKLVGVLVETMGDVFPELQKQQPTVEKIIRAEEESFLATLGRGIEIFNEVVAGMLASGSKIVSGDDAFRLYDTFGFPLDLTRLMAAEVGLDVDEQGFEHSMQEQKSRARLDRKDKMQVQDDGGAWEWFTEERPTQFLGYDVLELQTRLSAARKIGDKLLLVLESTPFYAESGGQLGDHGTIETETYRFEVADTRKDGELIVHIVTSAYDKVRDCEIAPLDVELENGPQMVEAAVDREARVDTERNHTATHLLHAALRHVLGEHVQQKGSLVTPERLRFDFSHFSKVSQEEIEQVEHEVNRQIRKAAALNKHAEVPYEEALSLGALAFFGDKYADRVRVIEVPGISIELCGGTHVGNIGQIGMVKILSESSVASGIRRIEAVTGSAAEALLWKEYRDLQQIRHLLKLKSDEAPAPKVQDLLEEKKILEKQLQESRLSTLLNRLTAALAGGEELDGCRIMTERIDGVGADELRLAGLALRERVPSSVGLLCSVEDGKVALVGFASDEAVRSLKLDAGKLVRLAAACVQGGGGGKPELATAGGKNPLGIDQAIETFVASVKAALKG
jgi:alanyl-tRNA synthetase